MRLAPIVLLAAACGAPPAFDEDGAPLIGAPGEGTWRTARVLIDGEPAVIDVEEFDGAYVLEDDIVLDPADVDVGGEVEQDLATVKLGRLWPNGVVYYKFSSSLSDGMRDRVEQAMERWEARTVVRFEQAGPNRDDYVLIKPFDKPYCRASIGHGSGVTYMWLNSVCTVGLIKHELGHTLGLYHEQSRQDRNDHVVIKWDNIKDGFAGNFKKYLSTSGKDVGTYDLDSIMHYSSYAFSKNGRPTIVKKSDGEPFGGWRTAISAKDAAGVDRRYGHVMD